MSKRPDPHDKATQQMEADARAAVGRTGDQMQKVSALMTLWKTPQPGKQDAKDAATSGKKGGHRKPRKKPQKPRAPRSSRSRTRRPEGGDSTGFARRIDFSAALGGENTPPGWKRS